MKVYRVEADDGTGPYRRIHTLVCQGQPVGRLARSLENHDAPRHPGPAVDGMFRVNWDYCYGFVDLAALWRWFGTEIDMTNGLLCWFNVVEYRCVSKRVVGRSGQCAFIKPALKPGRLLTVQEVMAARSDND